MATYRNILTGDVVTVEGPNADAKDEDDQWELVKAPAKAAEAKAEKG